MKGGMSIFKSYQVKSIFIFTFLLLFPVLLLSLIQVVFVNAHIKYKAEQLVIKIERKIDSSRIQALDLSKSLITNNIKFDCGYSDRSILSNRGVLPSNIRIIQIELTNGDKCSSLGVPINLSYSIPVATDEHNVFVSVSMNSSSGKREFLYIYNNNGDMLTALVNSSFFNEQLNYGCEYCYKIELRVKGLPLVVRGGININQSKYKYELNRTYQNNQLSISIISGDLLYYQVKKQLQPLVYVLGLIFGVIINILYWFSHHSKSSHEYTIALAIKKSEFVPYYQPIINSLSNKIVGQEVLVRWLTNCSAVIYPDKFIPQAEDSGLILPITEQIMDKVFQDLPQLKGWSSINIVATHLETGSLSKWFDGKACIGRGEICFELTERKRILCIESAEKEIKKLVDLGINFKLDDFGTGYGGFNYLQELGLRSIKIDKMFIDTIGTDDLKRNVLDAIIAFGKEAGMEIIAEGVETKEQVEYLAHKGVFLIQGYYYAKPMPLSELTQFYNDY
ncbi:EAL domain-containing protein [Shewanella sp.]|uniref:EAL domain-containing protein n=1 Tax=Shewanella sp. TaxID=50422 RepID=UPI001EB778E9|nr:EAL domain-containing protein [Shewanella sp.]NRB22413.1 EAL domain-containing protein [Shewanella sp.]